MSELNELGSPGGFAKEPVNDTLCSTQSVNDRFFSEANKGTSGEV